jgi:hypothetical protein
METLILRGVDYILQLLRIREDRDEKKKQRERVSLEAFRNSIVMTRAYLADMRNDRITRDRNREAAISQAWNTVGLKVRDIGTPEAHNIFQVFFEKADYWSDPEGWEKKAGIDISLKRVEDEINQILSPETERQKGKGEL